MYDELKQDLLHSLFCFKKANIAISRTLSSADGGLSITELSALGCIEGCDEKKSGTADDSHPQDHTMHHAMHETPAVSKAAISQMLGSLEKRGYIKREIDRDNRRKIIITLTKKGKNAVNKAGENMDALLPGIIERFGEDDSRNLVRLPDRFAKTVNETIQVY
ncbi:MAG: transcriptional regulator [Treponema sp.]|jgi:DNA-binding MarR family transcriptional regulator|nr:transcriptional regulator [Treponema sp.]